MFAAPHPCCRRIATSYQLQWNTTNPSLLQGKRSFHVHHQSLQGNRERYSDVYNRPQLRFPFLEKNHDNESQFEHEDISPSDLPKSPIMDAEKWDARYKRPSKESPLVPKDYSEQKAALEKNPYAAALATPIRCDFWLNLRLPRYFFIRMSPLLHPTAQNRWILPSELRKEDKGMPRTKPSGYIISSNSLLLHLSNNGKKKNRFNRIIQSYNRPELFSGMIWRQDMNTYILKDLRQRVVDELVAGIRFIVSANKEAGKWRSSKVGCVLVWGDLSSEENENIHPRSLMEVAGKNVPVYDMEVLMGGSTEAQELKKKVKIEDLVKRNAIMLSQRSIELQLWLYKLSMFLTTPQEVKSAEKLGFGDAPKLLESR